MSLQVRDVSNGERGFTLPELLAVILLMGILFAIASANWFDLIESRQVDSATNQLASELRLAHSRATNQLTDWRVSSTGGSSSYTIERVGGTPPPPRMLDGAQIDTAFDVRFKVDGSVEPSGSPITITVGSDDGDPTSGPEHDIVLNTVTSRVKIDP